MTRQGFAAPRYNPWPGLLLQTPLEQEFDPARALVILDSLGNIEFDQKDLQ